MSTLVIEVCRVAAVEPHPRADRLAIATVKGWKVCIRYDPATGQAEFQPGDKCVYFPPDSVLPPALAHGPDDDPPGRLNVMKYLAMLPKDHSGNRPPGGRVKAARLRGEQSYGVMMRLDPAWADDPNWEVGRDVKDHYGVTKWEPPPEQHDGEAEPAHPRFHRYTDIEHWRNFPDVLADGEEVVITEKIHGKNCRVGLVLDADPSGAPAWVWMAGSHDVRRKERGNRRHRFHAAALVERMVLDSPQVEVGQIIDTKNGRYWRVDEVTEEDGDIAFRATQVHSNGAEVEILSEFWEPLSDPVRRMLAHVRDAFPWPEPKFSLVLFGEIYGRGVQDMEYGRDERGFRAFDLAINGRYVNFDAKQELFSTFGVESVPVLYRGPFRAAVLDELTDGPTTLCAAPEAGRFAGREGIVVTPVRERIAETMLLTGTNGRVIFKSVSADYLARKGGTDSH